MKKIDFDEISHTYTVDGKDKPSVTQILKAVGLFPDFWGNDEDLAWYMRRGSMVHKGVEHILEWMIDSEESVTHEKAVSTINHYIEAQDEEIQGYLRSFREFIFDKTMEVYPIATERKVYTQKYDFCGTIDMTANIYCLGKVWAEAVIDFKCGQPEPEYAFQTAVYVLGMGDPLNSQRLRLGVYLDKNGKKARVCPYTKSSDMQVFQAARYVYSKQRGSHD